ncbi:MAG: ABC-F family ATP-binding cassette domain-containing protein [Candidatus Cloacimonetes bacterium]|nr:ABC-F family ATP-binding cassette domain-containing protein [Candidatus Cloacimonadota bacterium]
MQFIQLSKIQFTYPDCYNPVLDGIDLVIGTRDKIALIGKNGSGKTTLLKIILGRLDPSGGRISYPATPPRIAYLAQDTKINDSICVSDYLCQRDPSRYQIIGRIKALSGQESLSPEEGLELSGLWHEHQTLSIDAWEQELNSLIIEMNLEQFRSRACNTLSGGESTRLRIAALLLEHPDIIILDEPTNHLDIENLLWLEQWLNSYSGAVLYVSHDRVFIDNTATKVASLTQGKLEVRAGNYQSYTTDKACLQSYQLEQYQERNRLLIKLNEAAQRRRSWAKTFQKETKSEGGGHVYESIFNAARTQMQQARNIEKRITMLKERYPVEKPLREKPHSIRFETCPGRNKEAISISAMYFAYNGQALFTDYFFYLEGRDRLWLSGVNGSGKTTLLNLLAGVLEPDSGTISYSRGLRIGYYRQDLCFLDAEETVLGHLKTICGNEEEIQNLMGCLGLKNELAQERIGTLSWGEKAKVQLLSLLVGNYNVLLLDEPTNHLDIRSREMLEEALHKFEGAFVFVSHDRAFIQRLASREVNLSP